MTAKDEIEFPFNLIPEKCRTLDCGHTLTGLSGENPVFGDEPAHRIDLMTDEQRAEIEADGGETAIFWAATVDGTDKPALDLVELQIPRNEDDPYLTESYQNEVGTGCLYGLLLASRKPSRHMGDDFPGCVMLLEDYKFVPEHLEGCWDWTPEAIEAAGL